MNNNFEALTPQARSEPESGILTAAMHGFTKPGIIPFWSGEGNLPTPERFSRAATESLLKGETFYTFQGGIPELRQALARYHSRHYGREFDASNFLVTSGGMQAIQTAIQMISAEQDEIIIPTPAWPNYAGSLRVKGAVPVEVPMDFLNGKWMLDLDRLFAAVTPRTKAICLNSPSNPLGWTATKAELIAIRDHCRKHGLWIIGDEVYSHFYFQGQRAPSFLDVCDTEEQLLLCNTFSKNWAMTGWRVGWLQAPKALAKTIETFIQYNSSGTPVFLQRGCTVALDEGDDFISQQVATAKNNRDKVVQALQQFPQLKLSIPDGAFYMFFGIDGMTNSLATSLRIIDEANVGFAPGGTFGLGGEGYLRMCFLKDESKLEEGLNRFASWLKMTKQY